MRRGGMLAAMYSKTARGRLLGEFEASDLSEAAYCRKAGISRATLRSWRQSGSSNDRRGRSSLFARVNVTPHTSSSPLELYVGRVRVVVPPGTDLRHLRAVLAAIGAHE